MEKRSHNNSYTKNQENKSQPKEQKDELPKSKYFKYSYEDLVKTAKEYILLIENYPVMGNTGKKVMSKDDLIVIRNLLEEILLYIGYLSNKPLEQVEFFTLYQNSIRILDLLKGFKLQKDIILIEKLTRMKFLKIEYKMLINTNDPNDALKAEAVVDELISIQKENGQNNNDKTVKVATISQDKLREIAQTKLVDLTAYDVEQGMKIIEGTARNMGIVVEK